MPSFIVVLREQTFGETFFPLGIVLSSLQQNILCLMEQKIVFKKPCTNLPQLRHTHARTEN